MYPTNYDVTILWVVSVLIKILACIFKFYFDRLPLPPGYLPLGFTVWEATLYSFHQKSKFSRNHPEKKYNALLVDRFVPQPPKVDGVAVNRPAVELLVPPLPTALMACFRFKNFLLRLRFG